MQLRENLLPWVTWQLGDGQDCKAIGQPWFQGATLCHFQPNVPRNVMVGQLVLPGTSMGCRQIDNPFWLCKHYVYSAKHTNPQGE